MSLTKKANSKANVKQKSAGDMPLLPKVTTANLYAGVSTLGQTVVNLPFSVDQSNKLGFKIFIDGKRLTEGSANDYTFSNIINNASSQITLNDALVANLNIIAENSGLVTQVYPNLPQMQADIARRQSYINYVVNGNAEGGVTTGWNLYNDGAAASPVDGTGGTANVTWSVVNVGVLRGAYSFQLSKDAANRQGQGVSYDFTIDPADCQRVLSIKAQCSGSVNYAGGSAVCYIYDRTNNQLISVSPVSIPSSGPFEATFISTASQAYRVIFHVADAGSTAWTLTLDDIMVGPMDAVYGAPMSDWTTYSMTITGTGSNPTKGTIVRDEARWRRVGDSMEIEYNYSQSGAGSGGSGQYRFSLPPGFLIDTSKISIPNQDTTWVAQSTVGTANAYNTTGYDGAVFVASSSTLGISLGEAATPMVQCGSAAFSLANAVQNYSFRAIVPIANWASNVVLGNSRVEFAYNSNTSDANDTTSFAYGPSGIAIGSYTTAERSKRVRFANPVSATDKIFLQVQENGNWVDLADHELHPSKQSSVRYGIRIVPVVGSQTDFDVKFGDGGGTASGASYGAAGSAWSGFGALNWRLVKSANPLAVEVGQRGGFRSWMYLDGGNGHGATNTKIRRFATVEEQSGTDITYVPSASLGDSFVINSSGLYSIVYGDSDGTSGAPFYAITVNDSALSTAISTSAITYAQGLRAVARAAGTNQPVPAVCTVYLNAGDVVRAHTDGVPTNTASNLTYFRITKVSG